MYSIITERIDCKKKFHLEKKMLLAVDVGNSHMVLGLFDGKNLLADWRVRTCTEITPDEMATLLHSLLHIAGYHLKDIKGVIIGSVVPPMESVWTQLSKKYFKCSPLLVSDKKLITGMSIVTDNPTEVGADRIINAVAAYNRYKSALIIVDFGTAITWDCVTDRGEYVGGAIAPGLGISFNALIRQTAKLPRIDISTPPEHPIGTNTETALKSGLLFGFGGMVEGLVRQIRQHFSSQPTVIATGGMAGIIAPYAPSIEAVEPLLTLEGLQILYEMNVEQ